MEVEIRHLKLIEALSEEGTQTRAAKRLYLTQSALSHQLTDLERKLGTNLFNRVGRRMTLTRAGRRVLAAGKDVLPQMDALTTDLKAIAAGKAGTIRLTTQCYTCYNWLPRVIPSFRTRFPDVDIEIAPEASERAIEAVETGDIDLALAYDFRPSDNLAALPLWTDELVAVVPPNHRLAGKIFVEAEDFAEEHLLLQTARVEESHFYRSVLDPAGVRPKRVSPLRLTEAATAMVAAGLGISVMTRWTVARELSAGEVVGVRVTELGLRRNWSAVRLASADCDLPLVQLSELLRRGPMEVVDSPELLDSLPRTGTGCCN